MLQPRSVLVALLLVQVFFSGLPIAAKLALREMSSPAIALLRVSVAAIFFVIIHELTVRERIRSARDYLRLAAYSLMGVSMNQLLYITGLTMTTATSAQMLITGGPALTLMVAMLWGKEAPTPAKWLGIGLAGAGALILIGVGAMEASALGNIIIVINMVFYSIYLVAARDIVHEYHPLTVITWIFIFGALGLMPFGLVPAWNEFHATSTQTRLILGWMIVFPTVIAYYLNMWALTKVESSVVSTFVYLQPIMTAAVAIPILGERPSLRMIPAAVLIFVGVFIAIRSRPARIDPADQAIVET